MSIESCLGTGNMDLVDLVNHLLIFSGCETPENLVMEAGNSAPPILSQTHANNPRTQTLKQSSPWEN